MDLAAFIQFVDEAPRFILSYEDKQLTLAVQMEAIKTASVSEHRYLTRWIGENSEWLLNSQEKYNKCLTIQALGVEKIEKIKEIYEELYKET